MFFFFFRVFTFIDLLFSCLTCCHTLLLSCLVCCLLSHLIIVTPHLFLQLPINLLLAYLDVVRLCYCGTLLAFTLYYYHALLTLVPWCYCTLFVLTPYYSNAVLFSCIVVLVFVPYLLSCPTCFLVFTPCCSLVLTPCCSLVFMPCCFHFCALLLALVALLLLPCHRTLLLTIFKYLLPPLPPPLLFRCLIIRFCALLLTWLVGIPSSFFCANGGAWSNTNKLHPTIKVPPPPKFSNFFLGFIFCLFILFLFVIFVLSWIILFSVVCEF